MDIFLKLFLGRKFCPVKNWDRSFVFVFKKIWPKCKISFSWQSKKHILSLNNVIRRIEAVQGLGRRASKEQEN